MNKNPLGQEVSYKNIYDNSLLFPIERGIGRNKIKLNENLPFNGYDLWNCYEVSWLNLRGKPEVRIVNFIVPANSPYLIESKSIKLYLNSFNNTKFSSQDDVYNLIKTDLNKASKSDVEVYINKLDNYNDNKIGLFNGVCIDEIDVEIDQYHVNPALLKNVALDAKIVEEDLYSNLFKSNCLVTGQPDWASIFIRYKGPKIDHKSLLQYIVSYRNHNGFHEECVERIFVDLMNICKTIELSVFAKYTRRGGVDINPLRTNLNLKNTELNKIRDVRQ